jgi:hypothetical protein
VGDGEGRPLPRNNVLPASKVSMTQFGSQIIFHLIILRHQNASCDYPFVEHLSFCRRSVI